MSGLLNLPVRLSPALASSVRTTSSPSSLLLIAQGTGAMKGYVSLDTPVKEHTVSAGGIQTASIELGDLANDAYFDEVRPTLPPPPPPRPRLS